MENKRDLSISMARANVIVFFISIPIAILQFLIFVLIHGPDNLQITWNPIVFIFVLLLGIVVHELLHALGGVAFGHKSFSSIKFGFQWKSFTPYAHLKGPMDIDAYRASTLLPGLVLGVLVYLVSLLLGDGNVFVFGLLHTASAGGDFLILWLIRHVKSGTQVEDHPTNAGCYVIER
jgi:hypothetical protein